MKAIMMQVSLRDINCHAQEFMDKYGIKYQMAVPQSISDCWQFFMCEFDEDSIPDFVNIRNDIDPSSYVGNGIGQAEADTIHKWAIKNMKQEK